MTHRPIIAATLAMGLLAACAPREVILPGERLDLRAGMAGAAMPDSNSARPISLPVPQVNDEWTHRGGGPDHQITHPALGPALTQIFAVNIGEGDSRRARITADPVVAGGRIYTLDARAGVAATSLSGQLLWTRDVTPETDGRNDASGGGIAVAGNKVFVTTGFGRLSALDAATGAVIWVQDLDAPGGSAPTVMNGQVYVVARDSRAWAVDAETGLIVWQLSGTPSNTGFAGGAGAAVTPDIAIFPFPSGEVLAAFPLGGLRRWSSVIAGARIGQAAGAASTDIGGDPVIDGNTVYVGNVSGRVVAMDIASGDRIWTAVEGAVSPVFPAGGSIFLVNDLNELVRLDAADGSPVWRVALPGLIDARPRRQNAVHAQYGPILAGGRLLVASSDGAIRQFDPASGAHLGDIALPGGAASHPVVAGQTLYIVTKRGQLVAFR